MVYHQKSEAWSPAKIFTAADQFAFNTSGQTRFEYRIADLHYACCLMPAPGTDRLYVNLGNWIDRASWQPPAFSIKSWMTKSGGHLLNISDPTLFLSRTLNVGLFIGTRTHDATSDVVDIAKAVATAIGVEHSRIVYLGSSAAGFAAAMAAIRSEDGSAVVINSLFDLSKVVVSTWTAEFLRIYGQDSFKDAITEAPERSSVTAALQASHAAGKFPRVSVAQNALDAGFHTFHYVPFCKAFGLPVEGGTDPTKSLRTYSYRDDKGHFGEPLGVIDRMLKEI